MSVPRIAITVIGIIVPPAMLVAGLFSHQIVEWMLRRRAERLARRLTHRVHANHEVSDRDFHALMAGAGAERLDADAIAP